MDLETCGVGGGLVGSQGTHLGRAVVERHLTCGYRLHRCDRNHRRRLARDADAACGELLRMQDPTASVPGVTGPRAGARVRGRSQVAHTNRASSRSGRCLCVALATIKAQIPSRAGSTGLGRPASPAGRIAGGAHPPPTRDPAHSIHRPSSHPACPRMCSSHSQPGHCTGVDRLTPPGCIAYPWHL